MVLNIPPSSPFGTGITRIHRAPAETQEQFDATKGDAVYHIGNESHTLVLDGKLDESIASGISPWYGDRLLTEVAEIAPSRENLRQACLESHNWSANPTVDLGTGAEWNVFPNKDLKTSAFTSYDLISGPGPQTLNVRFAEGGLDVSVHSQDKQRDVGHTMRAFIADDGVCTPTVEGVTWHVAGEAGAQYRGG